MVDGRCSICYWDGSRSRYIKSLLFEPSLDIPKIKKKTVLLTNSVLFEVNEDELEDDYNTIDYFESRTRTVLEETFSIYKKNVNLGWNSNKVTILEKASMNCGQCAVCEAWVTDMKKPHPMLELDPGFVIDGRLFCEDDLPE
jgi:hypothetical protein